LHFRLYPLRLTFQARETLSFPLGTAANRLRGAFGAILHKLGCAAIFEPSSEEGPSGLIDRPRPFVFRASHLDGGEVAADGRDGPREGWIKLWLKLGER
jgi:hypothetical protein